MTEELSDLQIRGRAILIGYTPEGKCAYNIDIDLSDYYDGEHVWDSAVGIKRLGLEKLHGYLFDLDGGLDQEFESTFDLESGIYKKGWARFADGTFRED